MKKRQNIIETSLPAGRQGFTLFFAMLAASLALSIGLAIYDLTVRELDISATATQSQYAIYAADMGIECALYWDNHYIGPTDNNGGSKSAFATSSSDLAEIPTSGVTCNGQDIAATAVTANTWPVQTAPNGPPTATAATTIFKLTIPNAPSNPTMTYCATVVVSKSGTPTQSTTVTSHGYNNCGGGTLQLERVLQASY